MAIGMNSWHCKKMQRTSRKTHSSFSWFVKSRMAALHPRSTYRQLLITSETSFSAKMLRHPASVFAQMTLADFHWRILAFRTLDVALPTLPNVSASRNLIAQGAFEMIRQCFEESSPMSNLCHLKVPQLEGCSCFLRKSFYCRYAQQSSADGTIFQSRITLRTSAVSISAL